MLCNSKDKSLKNHGKTARRLFPMLLADKVLTDDSFFFRGLSEVYLKYALFTELLIFLQKYKILGLYLLLL